MPQQAEVGIQLIILQQYPLVAKQDLHQGITHYLAPYAHGPCMLDRELRANTLFPDV